MHMAPEDCFATFVLCYFAFSFVVLEHVCKKKKVECLQMFENYGFRKHQCVWSWQNRFKLRYFWETHSKTNLKPDSAGFSCVFQQGWLLQDTGSNVALANLQRISAISNSHLEWMSKLGHIQTTLSFIKHQTKNIHWTDHHTYNLKCTSSSLGELDNTGN